MLKDLVKKAKLAIDASEDANRMISGLRAILNFWWSRHGGRYYYDGFAEKKWFETRKDFEKRLKGAAAFFRAGAELLDEVEAEFEKKGWDTTKVKAQRDRLNLSAKEAKQAHDDIDKFHKLAVAYGADDPADYLFKEEVRDPDDKKKVLHEKGSINPDYKDLALMLDPEEKEKIDAWWSSIDKLFNVTGGFKFHLRDDVLKVIEKHERDEHIAPKAAPAEKSKDWKDQLQKKQDELARTPTSHDQWITDQYTKYTDLILPREGHLLKDEQKFGLVELPIFLGRAYIDDVNLATLTRMGFEWERVLGNYIQIKNAMLLGIRTDLVEQGGLHAFTEAYNELEKKYGAKLRSTKYKVFKHKLTPIGPLRKKGKHVYSLLVPAEFIQHRGGGFYIQEWEMKVAKVQEQEPEVAAEQSA